MRQLQRRSFVQPYSETVLRLVCNHRRTDNGSTLNIAGKVHVIITCTPSTLWITAHDEAVREALAESEKYAATRVRLDGANENRTTANWIVAAYRHDTSRELDPQLHIHAVAANLSYDGVEDRWKALQASGLYERRAYLTEVYRNTLAREVRSLGYEIESRRDSRGRDYGFEIRGVSHELLERYSQRSAQRDAAIELYRGPVRCRPESRHSFGCSGDQSFNPGA